MGWLSAVLLLATIAALLYVFLIRPTPSGVFAFYVLGAAFVGSVLPAVAGSYGKLPPMILAAAAAAGVPVLFGLAVAFRSRPAWLAWVLVVAMPLRVPIPVGSETVFLLVPLYLVLAAGFLSMTEPAERGEPAWRRDALRLPIGVLVGVTGVSLFWTADPVTGTIRFLCFWVAFALLYHIAAKLLADERLRTHAIDALVMMGGVLALVGLIQRLTGVLVYNPKLSEGYFATTSLRVNSLFWDPNMFGRFLVVVVLVCAVRLQARSCSALRRWMAGVTIALSLPALLLTYSRSSWIALAVAAILLAWRLAGAKKAVAAAAALVLVLTAIFVLIDSPAFNLPYKPDVRVYWEKFLGGRLGLVQGGIAIFAAHPVAGVGVGGFPKVFPRYRPQGFSSKVVESHNSLVTVAGELGIVGLAALMWLLVSCARVARDALGPNSVDAALGAAAVFGVVAILVHSLFYGALFEDPFTWFLGALTVALAGAGFAHGVGASSGST